MYVCKDSAAPFFGYSFLRFLRGGELGWPNYGSNRWGRSSLGGPSIRTGPYFLLGAAGVSPCRCEPLRAGCCGGEEGVGV